jgi:hypothetical protein
MKRKMGLFGAKLLTLPGPAWFNRARLIDKGLKGVKAPFRMAIGRISLDTGRAIGYE